SERRLFRRRQQRERPVPCVLAARTCDGEGRLFQRRDQRERRVPCVLGTRNRDGESRLFRGRQRRHHEQREEQSDPGTHAIPPGAALSHALPPRGLTTRSHCPYTPISSAASTRV